MDYKNEITVLCLNPSLEITFDRKSEFNLQEDNIVVDKINFEPGGKGINVCRILRQVDIHSEVRGFIGGEVGIMLKRMLKSQKINFKFYNTAENTRASVILNSEIKEQQTVIRYLNSKVDILSKKAFFKDLLNQNFTLMDYITIGKLARYKQAKLFIDNFDEKIKVLFRFNPFLITPNLKEAEKILKFPASNTSDVIKMIKEFVDNGCTNVIIKLGKDGAIAFFQKSFFEIKTVAANIVNPIGAGDALMAGLIANFQKHSDEIEYLAKSFKFATSSLYCLGSGKIDLKYLRKLPDSNIRIIKMKL